jgi:hypothetical protein
MRSRRTQAEEYQTPPELMIESAMRLLSTLPGDRRAAAMREMVEHLTAVHEGLPLPAWIGMLSDLADREGIA